MNTFILIIITLTITTAAVKVEGRRSNKRCESSSADCNLGECCTSKNRCKRLIAEGNRCSVFKQLMGDQCPCVQGSTCSGKTNELTLNTRMVCTRIVRQEIEEVVEGFLVL